MPRGGRRTGVPGASYANRTDLQAVRTAPSQQYGQRAAQERAQKALPLAGATDPGPSARPAPPTAAPVAPPVPMPGMLTPLDAPTARPNEPLTAGLPIGAGPGAEANPFSQVGSADDAVLAIRAAYQAYPSEELRMVLEKIDTSQ